MTDYTVTYWPTETTRYDSLHEALAAIKTQIETVVNTKTIHLMAVYPTNGGQYEAALVYDT